MDVTSLCTNIPQEEGIALVCETFKEFHNQNPSIGKRGLVVGRWTCNPEVLGSNPTPCHWMDLSLVAPNSNSPRCVNSQLVSLPPVGILNLLCLICTIFVCYTRLNIFTWNLRDINVYYYCYYYY